MLKRDTTSDAPARNKNSNWTNKRFLAAFFLPFTRMRIKLNIVHIQPAMYSMSKMFVSADGLHCCAESAWR